MSFPIEKLRTLLTGDAATDALIDRQLREFQKQIPVALVSIGVVSAMTLTQTPIDQLLWPAIAFVILLLIIARRVPFWRNLKIDEMSNKR